MYKSYKLGDIEIREAADYIRVYDKEHPEGRRLNRLTIEDLSNMLNYAYNMGSSNAKETIRHFLTDHEWYREEK